MSAQRSQLKSAIPAVAAPLAHHPTSERLAGYALGDCSPGTALLVARHVAQCAKCAETILRWGSSPPSAWVPPAAKAWRTVSPGFEMSPVREVSGLGELVFMVRAAAGARMPGAVAGRIDEFVVLSGGILQGGQVAGAGDFWLPASHPQGELVACKKAGLEGLFTTSDEAWEHEG